MLLGTGELYFGAEAVRIRNGKLAEAAVEQDEELKKFKEKLNAYGPDSQLDQHAVLGARQIARILMFETEMAFADFMQKREAGLHNDPRSLGAGLVALVDPVAVSQIKLNQGPRILEIAGASFEPASDDPELHVMRLPSGVYDASDDEQYMTLYSHAEATEDGRVQGNPGSRFCTFTNWVVRIEDTGGALWQHPERPFPREII